MAMERWVIGTFPVSVVSMMSHEDWAILFAAVAARERLKKTFDRLRVDPDRAMRAVGGQ